MKILTLPPELFEHILFFLRPADIVHIGQTCKSANNAIKPSNSLLWHNAFLAVFDDLQHTFRLSFEPSLFDHSFPQNNPSHWHDLLKQRMTALKIVHPYNFSSFKDSGMPPEKVIETILDILETAKCSPTNVEISRGIHPRTDDRTSLNLQLLSPSQTPWDRLESLIHECFDDVAAETQWSPGRRVTRSISYMMKTRARSAAASRLHVLYGRTSRERHEYGAKDYVRQIVYDWDNPSEANEYGPYLKNGSGMVDWKIVEACASVMLRHFEISAEGRIAMPQGFFYSIPCRTLVDPTIPEDWAKLTGAWVGTYSFLDYPDLVIFNTQTQPRQSLEDAPETDGDLMVLDLKLDMTLKEDRRLQSKLPQNNSLPTLYFTGTSRPFDMRGHPREFIRVAGRVSLCPSGREVRWRYIISYRGQDQWLLEGVQPGGVRSGPIYGQWTHWEHEEHAPVGAFMYVSEELCKTQELVLAR